MRIALVHDWLTTYAGAERVLEQVIQAYPEADLFALCDFLPDDQRAFLQGKTPSTTFIQRLPFARKKYRSYLSLMPLAVEQHDLSPYDIVISSSHAVAKGVLTGPDQLHVSYVHSPVRYAWDLQHQYLREAGLDKGLKGWLARWILHKLRIWDYRTAHGVDAFVANSGFIARRIRKVYGRDATVIHPPVSVVGCSYNKESKEDFYLVASRMVPYKRVDLVVQAFAAMPERRLVVVGDGPEMSKVKANAARNVEVLGYQDSETLRDLMARARAFVFAAEEDFGIMPVEVQAHGTPVIAYGKGGALETVIDGKTGVLFDRQEVNSIADAVNRFEQQESNFNPDVIRQNTEQFSESRFRNELIGFVQAEWDRFQAEIGRGLPHSDGQEERV